MKYDLVDIQLEIINITRALRNFLLHSDTLEFEEKLLQALYEFNTQFFPVPEFKYRVKRGEINGDEYGEAKAKAFLPIYQNLVYLYDIRPEPATADNFLDKWYAKPIRDEIRFVYDKIQSIKNPLTKKILSLVLSRTIRSCRATTHADLATLVEPVTTTYYCTKHGKVCKPLFSILRWWETYTKDTIKRLAWFAKLRTETLQICLTGDSRALDLVEELKKEDPAFADLVRKQKIRGIFSSPPYVGLIDYHEQHAYAYDLFQFERRDEFEIGPLFKGQGREAKRSYIDGITAVLHNCKRFLVDDYDIFLVANDKHNLYPAIAEQAGMQIVNQYKRPVLNRTEKDKGAYSETIFHLKARSASESI